MTCGGNRPRGRPMPLRVTFDTNTLSGVVDPSRVQGGADHVDCLAVKAAVVDGRIRGFFGEAVVALDALGGSEKVDALGATRIVSETTSTGPNQITISIGPRWRCPAINPQFLDRIAAARRMGMRALIGPRRFGDSLVVQGFGGDFYEPDPSAAALVKGADITNTLDAQIVARGLGRALVLDLGKAWSERDGAAGELWLQGLERTRDAAERKKACLAISEWADGEAVASHAGYANDLFCTEDRGGGLGERSILHASHRAWLSGQGVECATVAELAQRLEGEGGA